MEMPLLYITPYFILPFIHFAMDEFMYGAMENIRETSGINGEDDDG